MQETKAQEAPQAAPTDQTATGGTYAMSREGHRQAIILLLGVISLWIFALWTLISLFDGGITGAEWVSALLMLGILVVAPVVAWILLEEASCRITTDAETLRYTTLGGIVLAYKWDEITLPKRNERTGRVARFFLGDTDEDGEEPREAAPEEPGDSDEQGETRAFRAPDRTQQIANPVARFLHRLAYNNSLPIHTGLENREALMNQISSRFKVQSSESNLEL